MIIEPKKNAVQMSQFETENCLIIEHQLLLFFFYLSHLKNRKHVGSSGVSRTSFWGGEASLQEFRGRQSCANFLDLVAKLYLKISARNFYRTYRSSFDHVAGNSV